MGLSIEVRRLDSAIVLELSGRLSVLEQELRQCAGELIERGERIFFINLASLSYLDNSGLGQLFLIHTMLKDRGGEMRLVRPTPRIRKLLSITKLDTVFELVESEDATDDQGLRSTVSA